MTINVTNSKKPTELSLVLFVFRIYLIKDLQAEYRAKNSLHHHFLCMVRYV